MEYHPVRAWLILRGRRLRWLCAAASIDPVRLTRLLHIDAGMRRAISDDEVSRIAAATGMAAEDIRGPDIELQAVTASAL